MTDRIKKIYLYDWRFYTEVIRDYKNKIKRKCVKIWRAFVRERKKKKRRNLIAAEMRCI